MFTDWSEALEAESIPLDPTTAQQYAAAARVTARTRQARHDASPGRPRAAHRPRHPHRPAPPHPGNRRQTRDDHPATEAIDVPVIPLTFSNPVQELLDGATAHPAAAVRNRANRITADLAELTERRDTEAAQREAEEKVTRAKAELERAQEELRTVKANTRTTAAAPTAARTGSGSGRTREELAAIRTWARENGHPPTPGWCPSESRRRTTPPTRTLPGRPADPWTPHP
ncbi:hypothetical protein ACIQD5_28435 [Streptomyces microflavus]|uniref:hypothetical protein n=1 Tax=Streptomyces microflavus TaxID=1919 RepID=UPI0037F293F6